MTFTPSDAQVIGASPTPAAPLPNGLDADSLAAVDEARMELRRQSDKVQLHMALHDLAEGFRGMIRVAPFASVATAVAFGLLLGRRKRRPATPRR